MIDSLDPHKDQPILQTGTAPNETKGAMVLLHGRGASAEDILYLSAELEGPGFLFIAPQAAAFSWYPGRFLDPIHVNEPWLTSALNTVKRSLDHLADIGITHEQIILLGFSQGACLALEYVARDPRRYGGVVGLSGGLIGADEEQFEREGSLAGTPVFLGCSQDDPHIPQDRFEDAARILASMGADVTARLYPDLGHSINQDELDFIHKILVTLITNHD
jgi:predicted esterase